MKFKTQRYLQHVCENNPEHCPVKEKAKRIWTNFNKKSLTEEDKKTIKMWEQIIYAK